MRRRLEKWSQGWVTPTGRNQPRQRTASREKRALSAELGATLVEPACSGTTAEEEDVFHCHTEPVISRHEAPQVDFPISQAMCCLEVGEALLGFVPCTVQLTAEALHLDGAAKRIIRLDQVTDAALVEDDLSRLLPEPAPATFSPEPKEEAAETDLAEMCLWDIPPIPFGKLPWCRPSLPARWQMPNKVPKGCWMQGQPLRNFDRSNLQVQEAVSLGLQPLRPSLARLPPQKWTADQTSLAASPTRSLPAEMKSGLVVWVGSCPQMAKSSGRHLRLREGHATVLAFPTSGSTGAAALREELLSFRLRMLNL